MDWEQQAGLLAGVFVASLLSIVVWALLLFRPPRCCACSFKNNVCCVALSYLWFKLYMLCCCRCCTRHHRWAQKRVQKIKKSMQEEMEEGWTDVGSEDDDENSIE